MVYFCLPTGRLIGILIEIRGFAVDVRNSILEESIRLFGENGYEGTSVQAIADAVGVRKQSLFHHFKSKEDIINQGEQAE